MVAERSTGDHTPQDPPEDGGVGESRPVKEGARGRPGRDRHKTGPGPGKGGRRYGGKGKKGRMSDRGRERKAGGMGDSTGSDKRRSNATSAEKESKSPAEFEIAVEPRVKSRKGEGCPNEHGTVTRP